MWQLLRELAAAAARAAVDAIAKRLARKPQPEPQAPPHPTWLDVERRREQERSSIAHKVKR